MSWFKDILYTAVKELGGTLAPKGVGEKRVQICETLRNGKPCPYAGQVEIEIMPFVTIKDRGCTICGCPFKTKPFMLTFFNPSTLQVEKITCPHPKGDMWAGTEIELNKN